mmetsp:Transcript_38570/g.89646  ORF Transcript_38570/g.89646 Transcript_38570/m.89646 type:complete len:291 (-) Transcript_38570:94-966(-)
MDLYLGQTWQLFGLARFGRDRAEDNDPEERYECDERDTVMFWYYGERQTLRRSPQQKVFFQESVRRDVLPVAPQPLPDGVPKDGRLGQISDRQGEQRGLHAQVERHLGQDDGEGRPVPEQSRVHVVVDELLAHALVGRAVDEEGQVARQLELFFLLFASRGPGVGRGVLDPVPLVVLPLLGDEVGGARFGAAGEGGCGVGSRDEELVDGRSDFGHDRQGAGRAFVGEGTRRARSRAAHTGVGRQKCRTKGRRAHRLHEENGGDEHPPASTCAAGNPFRWKTRHVGPWNRS